MEGNKAACFAEWALGSATTGMAAVHRGVVEATNARFDRFAAGGGAWRWLSGPHASTTYPSLQSLVIGEAAVPRTSSVVSRFERSGCVLEMRFERGLGARGAGHPGTMVVVHDVTTELRRVTAQQREREGLLHEERMQAMGVLASSVAHDLNHALNVIALRVATLSKDPALGKFGRTLDSLGKMVGDAAGIVARLQDLVLCDVGMPEMSGWQVAQEIQQLAPNTRVYMLTGWANEIGASDARRRLVRGVLAKPLDLHALKMLLSVPRCEDDQSTSLTH